MIVIESVGHIGISVSNLEEATKFYKDLFDFEIVEKEGSQNVAMMRVGDITIGLYEVKGYRCDEKSQTRISFNVDEEDFEDAVDEIEARGIPLIFGPEESKRGKTVIFADPDGNKIELSSPSPQ